MLPWGIAIAADGDLLVADNVTGVIRVNPVDGTQTVVSPTTSPPTHFAFPVGIALSPTTGEIFVADASCCGNGRGSNGGVIVGDQDTSG